MRKRKQRGRHGGWFAVLQAFAATDEEERGPLPDLSTSDILSWADAYHARVGQWPICKSGPIPESPGETWMAVEAALSRGGRGWPGGSTLARFLDEHRGKRNCRALPQFRVKQILAWADAHHRKFNEWPTERSGPIGDAPGETWGAVQAALEVGSRGLPGGSSLLKILHEHRGRRHHLELPPLTVKQVLAWADAHFRRFKKWPTTLAGPIVGAPGETWGAVQAALVGGFRGFPGGSSIAKVLAEYRGKRHHLALPPLTVKQILAWADAHFQKFKKWPTTESGPIADVPGEFWSTVQAALHNGSRGLPGGSSLVKLLAEFRSRRTISQLPHLTRAKILRWADSYFRRHGRWPKSGSGPVDGEPGQTWQSVHSALYYGMRGFPGGSSLARLLAQARGVRNRTNAPALTEKAILAWARAHFERHASWPSAESGPIAEAPGETWGAVDQSLQKGFRTLPGGASLARLLAKECGTRNRGNLPPLTARLILSWAAQHRRRTGQWPNTRCGPVLDAPGEKWSAIDSALADGWRGLPGGSSLTSLLRERTRR